MTSAQPVARDVPYSGERQLALWFGLLGGAFAWLLHLVTAWALAEFGCVGGLGQTSWFGISAVAWWAIVLTVVTELIALAAFAVAWFVRPSSANCDEEAAFESRRGAARAGILTSGLFALAIVFESIPLVYYVQGC
jgi:hypothetical protein